ncbi:DUF4193 family protein [Dactylosporangium roseum]|uniref:DUF4193 family protein n=1 Tax=Dactylosporangium roseum TaxID=47989 RepID=A0ABY5ZC22_9ACTN|nr:DUF4193 domain-containing protein [Dactylosporangium roseum]UWZ39670.1 DUF4193 family protein [Dactylosporangium roseum]
MSVDFDAPRFAPTDDTRDGIGVLTVSRPSGHDDPDDAADPDGRAGSGRVDDPESVDEEMSVPVVPMRADEFRCGRCYLVHHRSRRAGGHDGPVCRDCA